MGEVIAFPGARMKDEYSGIAVGQGFTPEPASLSVPEDLFLLSAELRRVERGSPDPVAVQGSVETASAVLSAAGARVELRGTERNPVIDATFEGPGASVRSAEAALSVAEAVRRVTGGGSVVSGAIAPGKWSKAEGGVRFVTGSPTTISASLRESSAPGQFLLSGAVWGDVSGIEVLPARGSGLDPRFEDVPVWVLRGLR